MSLEQKFVILISRITFSQEEENELFDILKKQLNWQEVIGICIQNKTLGLFWYNMIKRNYHHVIPKQFRLVCDYFYKCNKLHNLEMMEEFQKICLEFEAGGIKYAPLKGIQFLDEYYTDLGSRQLGDIDILIDHFDYKTIKKIMNDLGYIEGEYEYVEKRIIPIDRKLQLLHQKSIGNFHPFKKIADDKQVSEIFSIDFTYQIKGDSSGRISKCILENKFKCKAVYFIYLCTHLYKEAIGTYWIYNNKSDSIIKFCDIYELLVREKNYESFCTEVNDYIVNNEYLCKAVFYSIYHLNLIYQNPIILHINSCLNYEGNDLTDGFIDEKTGTIQKWKNNFFARLFYGKGKEEVNAKPHYMEFQMNPSDKYFGLKQ